MKLLTIEIRHFFLSARNKEMTIDGIAYLFIVLFMYTAASKFMDPKSFASVLNKSPLMAGYGSIFAFTIPSVELMVSISLSIAASRKLGLYASLILMTLFTLYLVFMVFSGSKLPCHCGGVISTMSWQDHIWFNLGFTLFAITALALHPKQKQSVQLQCR